jgi:pimeloyl-ACP methyl ester carboxylesterase
MADRRWLFVFSVVAATAAALASLACCGCFTPGATPLPPVKYAWVRGPQGQLRAEEGGQGGVPVIFVHGLAGNRRAWDNQFEHAQLTRRAVILDLRGHGESEPAGNGDYSIRAYASDVLAVADALDLQRFVLVGHSMGGAVAGAVAGREPDRVAGLLLASAVGDLRRMPSDQRDLWLAGFSPDRYEGFVEAWFSEMLSEAHPATREQVLSSLRRTPEEVVAASARGMADYDPLPALEAFRGPMLAVVTPFNNRPYSLQNVVPGLPAKEVPDASHWVQMDRPTEFNRIMDEFLAGLK